MRFLRSVAALSLAAALLTGCGGSSASSGTAGTSPSTGSSSSTTVSTEPEYGGVLVRPLIYGDPQNLDPIVKTHATGVSMVTMNIFTGLVGLDAEKGEIIPKIAKEWEVSADSLTYTFHLNSGVKFHNGREVTAADFKYSLERLADPKSASPNAAMVKDIVGVEAFNSGAAEEISGIAVVDDATLKITLSKVNATFLLNLATPPTAVVPKEEVEKLGDAFGSKPVGAGPFKLAEWVRDSEIKLVRFDDYFEGKPYLDGVTYRIMLEQATRENEFEAKKLDLLLVGDAQYPKYKNHPVYKQYLIEVPELFTRHIAFNTTRKPFDDPRVRQAFNYAIDRAAVVKAVLQDKAYPAQGIFPPTISAYNSAVKGYEFNPEKAKQLLAEAGYPDGFEADIVTTNHSAIGLRSVEAAMGYLEKVGIRLKPRLVDPGAVTDINKSGDFDMLISSSGGTPSPAFYLFRPFHSANHGVAGNAARYTNAEVDELIDEAMATLDEAKQKELLQKAEQLILADAPWWFYNYNKAVMVHQSWVHGLRPIPTDIDYQPMEKVWMSPRS